MRWRFPDPSEEPDRRPVVAAIQAFWNDFSSHQRALTEALSCGELPDTGWLTAGLKAIHPALSWELAGLDDARWLLAISGEAQRHLAPLIERIFQEAPGALPWAFASGRPPKPLAEASAYTERLAGRPLDGWTYRVEPAEHHLIAVHFGVPGCEGPRDRDAHIASMLACDALLGSELFERWVGAVRVHPAEGFEGAPLDGLRAGVEARRDALRQALPSRPVHSAIHDASWALYRFNPRRREDYQHRLDLFVGKTMYPALWQSAHGDISFYSERFSRLGETFVYLKLDNEPGFGDGGFEDKSELEDALDEALQEARLGCVIGGGSGLRYDYVDLALLDVPAAVEIVGRILREGKAPRRCWMLFFDEHLASEWIGFRPKTPPPPGF